MARKTNKQRRERDLARLQQGKINTEFDPIPSSNRIEAINGC